MQASIAIQRFDTAMMGQLRHMHAAHRGHVQRCRLEAYTQYKLIFEGSLLGLGGDKSMRHAQSAVRQVRAVRPPFHLALAEFFTFFCCSCGHGPCVR